MNSYLKEENIIGCIDLNNNNEIRSNTLAQLKRFKKNISGINGHRSVGGYRASIYNALSLESVETLVDAMKQFEKNI